MLSANEDPVPFCQLKAQWQSVLDWWGDREILSFRYPRPIFFTWTSTRLR